MRSESGGSEIKECQVAPEVGPTCLGGYALLGCVNPLECYPTSKERRNTNDEPAVHGYVEFPAQIAVTNPDGHRVKAWLSEVDPTIHTDPLVERVIIVPRERSDTGENY